MRTNTINSSIRYLLSILCHYVLYMQTLQIQFCSALRGENHNMFPSARSLFKWLLQSELGWSETGSRAFFQDPHVDAGVQGLRPPCTAFPGHFLAAISEVQQPELQLYPFPICYASTKDGKLLYYATMLSSRNRF